MIAVLRHRLAPTKRLDGRAEALHLRAGVVVVVLALDRIPAEGEKPCDAVAVGTVPGGDTTIGPVGLAETSSTWIRARARRPASAVVLPHLAECLEEESVSEAEVDEPRPGDLRRLDLVPTPDRAASSSASSRGGLPTSFAVRSATFVAKSPCEASFGRSS